jgi:hypothetical protein
MSFYKQILQELSRKSREQKFALFRSIFEPQPGDLILDVGASGCTFPPYTFEDFYPYPEQIVAGGIALQDVKAAKRIYPQPRYVAFDGCDLPFPDKSFDIVFSNAVLEHVVGGGRQEKFAREVMRVGKSWFVTTPNYWFPFETHSYLLFYQFLPPGVQRPYHRLFGKIAMGQAQDVALLSASSLQKLFPDSLIVRLRVTIWPETLVAYFACPSRNRQPRSSGDGPSLEAL